MSVIKRPVNAHKAYHAHIYFDESSLERAKKVIERLGEQFQFKIGRIHEKPIGPHPRGSCQIIFGSKDFDQFIPWLDENRDGLTVLVHGLTGDDLKDHTDYAYWLGDSERLELSVFED